MSSMMNSTKGIMDNLSNGHTTTAMSLVEEGVDLIAIRDLLGHSSVQTTEVYAKMSAAKARSAIEAASKEIVPKEDALWETNYNIKEWLKGMTQKKNM